MHRREKIHSALMLATISIEHISPRLFCNSIFDFLLCCCILWVLSVQIENQHRSQTVQVLYSVVRELSRSNVFCPLPWHMSRGRGFLF